MKRMAVSFSALLLAWNLQAAPTYNQADTDDRQKQIDAVQGELDRLTLDELLRAARWVDVMPGAQSEESSTDKPSNKPEAGSKEQKASRENDSVRRVIRGSGSRFRDEVRSVNENTGSTSGSSFSDTDGYSGLPDQFNEDDELVDYVVEMPGGNFPEQKKDRVRVKVKRGTMKLYRQIQELDKMLIDDVVRMTGPPLKVQ